MPINKLMVIKIDLNSYPNKIKIYQVSSFRYSLTSLIAIRKPHMGSAGRHSFGFSCAGLGGSKSWRLKRWCLTGSSSSRRCGLAVRVSVRRRVPLPLLLPAGRATATRKSCSCPTQLKVGFGACDRFWAASAWLALLGRLPHEHQVRESGLGAVRRRD
jgi:hypothetical protein